MAKYYVVGEYGVHASDAITQNIEAHTKNDAITIFCKYVEKNNPFEWSKMGRQNVNAYEQKSTKGKDMEVDAQNVVDQAADVLEEHVFITEDGIRYEAEADAWFHNVMVSFLRIQEQNPISRSTKGEILQELIAHYQELC